MDILYILFVTRYDGNTKSYPFYSSMHFDTEDIHVVADKLGIVIGDYDLAIIHPHQPEEIPVL